MAIRTGRFGKFLACFCFTEWKTTEKISKVEEADADTGEADDA